MATSRLPALLSVALLVPFARTQDAPVRFVTKPPLMRIAMHDLPALLGALPETRLGKLIAEPDVGAAVDTCFTDYAAMVHRWAHLLEHLHTLRPDVVSWEARNERDVYAVAWSDVRSIEMVATRSADEVPALQATLLLEPVPAAEARLAATFDAASERTWQALLGSAAAAEAPTEAQHQKIDGFPARICRVAPPHGHQPVRLARGAWFLHLPGQFAAGNGAPEDAGSCGPASAPVPGLALQIDVPRYVTMLATATGDTGPIQKALDALGLGDAGVVSWHLTRAGDFVQEDLSLEFGTLGGLLGALVHGMAPLVDQPLPENGMLQLRCAFDVRELVAASNQLLALADMPTLGELGLEEDLVRAWSGGLALAITKPAPGGLVPRLYASFGIVDRAALDRLLARLHDAPGLEAKAVAYDGQECVQLRLGNAPAAVQPTYCIRDGVVHFAESGASLRALLKAEAAGAPKALDVGDSKPPAGKGAIVPSFDLRFDEAAIHAALHDLWLPLLEKAMGSSVSDRRPLVPLDEMPEPDVVAPMLTKGRGVLRQQPDRLVLSMAGTVGGPELLALLTVFGPVLSAEATRSWKWQADMLAQQIASHALAKIHAAIESFTRKQGKRPASLAELLTSGELASASTLLVPGDEFAEPVLHDGKEFGKSSFRYYRDGLEVSPQGEKVTVHLITIAALRWQRLCLARDGTRIDGYGDFAQKTIAEIEQGK